MHWSVRTKAAGESKLINPFLQCLSQIMRHFSPFPPSLSPISVTHTHTHKHTHTGAELLSGPRDSSLSLLWQHNTFYKTGHHSTQTTEHLWIINITQNICNISLSNKGDRGHPNEKIRQEHFTKDLSTGKWETFCKGHDRQMRRKRYLHMTFNVYTGNKTLTLQQPWRFKCSGSI